MNNEQQKRRNVNNRGFETKTIDHNSLEEQSRNESKGHFQRNDERRQNNPTQVRG